MDRMELYVMLIHVQHVAAMTWLSLAKQTSLQAVLRDPRGCDGLMGLEEEQVCIYQQQGEAMEAVKRGAELAVLECLRQFRSCHWNCSTLQGLQVFGKATIQGTRESAFTHAVSGAGIALAVSRACSRGELHECGRHRKVRAVTPEEWISFSSYWPGLKRHFCSFPFSSAVPDLQPHGLIVGRTAAHGRCWEGCPWSGWQLPAALRALLAHMEGEYKSHGVWGSCEARTCWKVMPPFRHVGNILEEKSEGAAEVYPKWVRSCQLLLPRSSRSKPYTAHGLVYLWASPDFCSRDPRHSIFSTSGRQCKQTPPAMELLCWAGPSAGEGRAGGALRLQIPLVLLHAAELHWCC